MSDQYDFRCRQVVKGRGRLEEGFELGFGERGVERREEKLEEKLEENDLSDRKAHRPAESPDLDDCTEGYSCGWLLVTGNRVWEGRA